jgi:hypothetical protein
MVNFEYKIFQVASINNYSLTLNYEYNYMSPNIFKLIYFIS